MARNKHPSYVANVRKGQNDAAQSPDVLEQPQFKKPLSQRIKAKEGEIVTRMRSHHIAYFGIAGTDMAGNVEARLAFVGEADENRTPVASASAKYAEYYTHYLLNTGEGYNMIGLKSARQEFIDTCKALVGEHSTRVFLRATENCVHTTFDDVLGKQPGGRV